MAKKKPDIDLDDPEIIAEPVQPDAAIKFWQERAKLSWDEAKGLADGAKARAFYVTGLSQQDLVQLVSDGIEQALANGETLPQFRERILEAIKAKGWHGYRIENIFRTNMQSAYAAGRYKKMQAVKKSRPYWQYMAVLDKRVRPSHAILHGKVYPADHEFWDSNYPPNGFRCRCGVVTLSERQVKAQGLTVETEMPQADIWTDPKTKMEYPVNFPGADSGFRDNPFKEWASERLSKDLAGRTLPENWDYAEQRSIPEHFAEWVERLGEKMRQAEFHSAGERCRVGTLTKKTLAYLKSIERGLASPEISIGDSDIFHALREKKVKPLPLSVWKRLPELLAQPDAIYWDKQKPGLVYVVDKGKFVILVDYQAKVNRKKQRVNTVRTGASLDSLDEFKNAGRYEKIE